MDMPIRSAERDLADLMPLVYDELRQVAQQYLRRQPAGFTLRPTDLVHEACLHLMEHSRLNWSSTGHFRAIAASKIWQVIVDHVKRRCAQKRGGVGILGAHTDPAEPSANPGPRRARLPLDQITVDWQQRDTDLLDLAEALAELASESSRLRDVVILHWFGGLTHAECAAQLGISPSTAEKDFRYALAWLNRRLSRGADDGH